MFDTSRLEFRNVFLSGLMRVMCALGYLPGEQKLLMLLFITAFRLTFIEALNQIIENTAIIKATPEVL